MILILFFILISLEAVYEALPLKGSKYWSGIFEFVYRATVMVALFAWLSNYHFSYISDYNVSFWYIFGGFILLRFAIFDIIYNLMIGEPIFYIGSTKIYDRTFFWFLKWSGIPRDHFFTMLKLIALIISITWLLP